MTGVQTCALPILTYLTLNAPDDKVTYDMSVTPMGIVKVAPFGTKPMGIVDGTSTANRPLDAPTAPMGTAMTLLLLGIVLAAALWIGRPRRA